jgi:polysaccharide deacetylase family protein (PEP-CTERM system associated)
MSANVHLAGEVPENDTHLPGRVAGGAAVPPVHALSVDVEDWYHDGGLAAPARSEQRVETNVLWLLDILAAGGARATFFILGEVAEQYPSLVRRIAAAGHELASHGYHHRPLAALLWREFRHDVSRSIGLIEDTGGQPVRGYRAPYFSLPVGVRWPIETLAELGLRYDSSILPIDRPPGLELVCSRSPFRHENGLWEAPVAVLEFLGFWHLPLASGTGLRILPRALLMRAIHRFEHNVGPGVFYLHPWEIDPASPSGPGRGRRLLRMGRACLPLRLQALLRARRFAPIAEVFPQIGG